MAEARGGGGQSGWLECHWPAVVPARRIRACALVSVTSGVIKYTCFVVCAIPTAHFCILTFVLSGKICVARGWLAEVSLLPNPQQLVKSADISSHIVLCSATLVLRARTGLQVWRACGSIQEVLPLSVSRREYFFVFLTNTFDPEPHHHPLPNPLHSLLILQDAAARGPKISTQRTAFSILGTFFEQGE